MISIHYSRKLWLIALGVLYVMTGSISHAYDQKRTTELVADKRQRMDPEEQRRRSELRECRSSPPKKYVCGAVTLIGPSMAVDSKIQDYCPIDCLSWAKIFQRPEIHDPQGFQMLLDACEDSNNAKIRRHHGFNKVDCDDTPAIGGVRK